MKKKLYIQNISSVVKYKILDRTMIVFGEFHSPHEKPCKYNPQTSIDKLVTHVMSENPNVTLFMESDPKIPVKDLRFNSKNMMNLKNVILENKWERRFLGVDYFGPFFDNRRDHIIGIDVRKYGGEEKRFLEDHQATILQHIDMLDKKIRKMFAEKLLNNEKKWGSMNVYLSMEN